MLSGIGIDIVEIDKMKELVSRYPSKLNSILTPQELVFCKRSPSGGGFSRFALLFAAKEAALKSLGSGWERGNDMLDIEIIPLKNSRFRVGLSNRLKHRAEELSVKKLEGSFSSGADIAVAQVIALR